MRSAVIRTPVLLATLAVVAAAPTAAGGPQGATVEGSAAGEVSRAALGQYCVACHNDRLQTAGLVIDPEQLAEVGEHAEVWEKVVRKLRSTAMPPTGVPRPDAATYDTVASFLESELDRSAAVNPNPGRLPLVYRLTRTEYQNAIRDLLALDALPREMDYSLLLPADNAASGFDNIADLLFIAPRTMERYLDAARKISRLAVGDPTSPLMVNIHRISPEQPQDVRAGGLPVGTRGGQAIDTYLPLDADYTVDVELAGRIRGTHELEVTVDGERAALVTLGGEEQPPTEFRVPIQAGPRVVGVAFVHGNDALPEATLRPRLRSRGTQPAIAAVTITGPYDATGSGDTPSRRRIFVCNPTSPALDPSVGFVEASPPTSPALDPSAGFVEASPPTSPTLDPSVGFVEASPGERRLTTQETELSCAREILSTLVRRAYRRPATDADLDDLLPFYTSYRAEGGFERGIQKALERLLVSPQFLLRIERVPSGTDEREPGAPFRVSDLELASRLSFFLWSSIPDDELLDAAADGTLDDPVVLERQVRRMLADPRSAALVTNFAAQWLFLGDVALKEPDPLLFRHFDETLRRAFERETELFLASVLGENRSVLELVDADYTFVNERLADHYGIPHVLGSEFRRVTLPAGSMRGGLLGQGSILTLTSYSTRTSPVLRGKYVLENLLAAPPPPPPPDVPTLTTEGDEIGETRSIRDAMVRHRANPVCASCHAQMDPIGFAMERFDAIGRWRETDANQPIDDTGVLPDGTQFAGVAGLKDILLAQPERFVGAMTEKLLMYAIGRNLQSYDAPAVRAIVHRAARDDYRFDSLVLGVVNSTPFQMRAVSYDSNEQ